MCVTSDITKSHTEPQTDIKCTRKCPTGLRFASSLCIVVVAVGVFVECFAGAKRKAPLHRGPALRLVRTPSFQDAVLSRFVLPPLREALHKTRHVTRHFRRHEIRRGT